MTIEESKALLEETTKLNPSPIVELYELDLRPVGDDSILYFHNGSNGLRDSVAFKGVSFTPLPISITGFDNSGTGEPARPTLSIMNLGGFISSLILSTNDLVGAVAVRRRTFAKYLDGTGATGFKPEYPPDIFVIEQKLRENRMIAEFELGSGFDLDGFQFPGRDVVGSYCMWRYRGPGCGFGGRVAISNLANTFFSGGQNYRGIWSSNKAYYRYDCVEFEKDGYWKIFECTVLNIGGIKGDSFNPSTSPASWVERQRWRGEWIDTDYLKNDVVMRTLPIYGVSRVAPRDSTSLVLIAKSNLSAGTPAPPNSLYWDIDNCSKLTLSCRYRFDSKFGNAPLPFGGQPGTLTMPSDL